MKLNRRDFLKGAVVAGGTMVFVSGAVACSSDGSGAGGTSAVSAGVASSKACYTTFDTDILIVGAGAAGAEAAINAAGLGANVIIVDKKAFGHCGDSGLHYSGQMTSSDFGIDGDSVDVQLENAVTVGENIVDQKFGKEIFQAYADDRVTMKSENYGNLHYRSPENGKPFIYRSTNKPRCWIGFKLNNLSYRALEVGAKVMDYCTVTKLLTDASGAVVGATAIDYRSGDFYVFRTKGGVILATGGEVGLWGAGTVAAKFGGGVETLTGDGHSLAAPLGVEFRDLEFRAMYPSFGVLNPTGISNLAILYSNAHAQWEDAEGNKPLAAAAEEGPVSMRNAVVEWYKAQQEGRGTPYGGLYGPISHYMEGQAPLSKLGTAGDMWDQCKIVWEKQGNDLSHVEIGPQLVYDFGGIVTDIKGQTGVEGLYAAGEIAMHTGAQYTVFRMFSTAFVMGKRAAEAAVERSKTADPASIDWSQVNGEIDRVYGLLEAEPANPIRPHVLKHKIQDSAWKGAGALKSDTRCSEALEEFKAEEEELKNLYIADKSRICNLEWLEALTLPHMLRMARANTIASQLRTESRGTHLRAEYPERDNDAWCKNIFLKEVDSEFVAEVRDVVVTDYPATPGKTDLGGGVLSDF